MSYEVNFSFNDNKERHNKESVSKENNNKEIHSKESISIEKEAVKLSYNDKDLKNSSENNIFLDNLTSIKDSLPENDIFLDKLTSIKDSLPENDIFLDNLTSIKDSLPENVKFAFSPLSRELENTCAIIYKKVITFFNNPNNNLEYGLLVVYVMEVVETYKLTSNDKYIIAIRCIIEILKETDGLKIPKDSINDLIISIHGSIESVIQLTKGETLNRNIKGLDIIEDVYVTRRAIERIIEYIEQKKYNLQQILENVFLIVTQIMYIVGSYSFLNGSQKKDIVIEVIRIILTKYKETNTGNHVQLTFIQSVMDSIPSLIDTFVSVSDGNFNINVKKYCVSCFVCC